MLEWAILTQTTSHIGNTTSNLVHDNMAHGLLGRMIKVHHECNSVHAARQCCQIPLALDGWASPQWLAGKLCMHSAC
jgi:hypothetical protein